MAMLQFVVVEGPDKNARFPIADGDGHLLGRGQDVVYKLTDPRASRKHCEVQFHGDQVTLIDNGSTGGTFVNGSKITSRVLKPGDVINIGDTKLQFQLGDIETGSTISEMPRRADDDQKPTMQLAELSGRKLSHYDIHEVIRRTPEGMIFRAIDTNGDKQVAFQVMDPTFTENEDDVQRFVRAMKTVLPLDHPHLVRVLGAGRNGPYCWIAMEDIEGETMTQVIQRIGIAGMLDWKYAYRVAVHVARALDYAHGQNIIHRNITPDNVIMQAAEKQAKLGDLMLARALEGALAKQITKPGEMLGDVNYMSPERTKGQSNEIDGRSDLFSLGATVYALLTGRPPFAGSNMIETVTNLRNKEPEKPTKYQMSIPGLFEGLVLKLLQKTPGQRYQTAAELLEELDRIGKFQGATA